MPVMWNHVAFAKTASQSKSPGPARAIELSARSYSTLDGLWFAPVSRK